MLKLTGSWIVMLNEVKHLGFERDLHRVNVGDSSLRSE